MNNQPDFLRGAIEVDTNQPDQTIAQPDFLRGAIEVQPQESPTKSAARTLLQIPKTAAQVSPLGRWSSGLALGVSTTPQQELEEHRERVELFKRMYPGMPLPESAQEQKYLEKTTPAVQGAQEHLPTVENIARGTEKLTGIPLEAKTPLQKTVGLATAAYGLKPGTILEKTGAGAVAPSVSLFLQDKGLNPELSDFIGLIASGGVNQQKPNTPNPFTETPKATLEIPKPPGGGKPAEELESFLKGGEEFASEYELGQEVQKALTPKTAKVPTPNIPEKIAPPITKKITPSDKKLGIVPVSPIIKTTESEIGKVISPGKFKNTTEGGKATVAKIRAKDARLYRDINSAYKEAKEANSHLSDIHPELVEKANSQLEELNEMKDKLKSGPQRELAATLDELLDTLAYRETNGRITGYRPINNQTLINIAQSQGQKVDYDFAHGQPRNIFKPIIGAIKESAKITAGKDPKALKLLNIADKKYADRAEKFNNDYIRPFLDKSNKDFSKLYKGAQDVDEFSMLRNVLEDSKAGKNISNAILRDFVEQKLSPHIKSGNAKAFEKQLDELGAVISPKQMTQIRDNFYAKSPLRTKNITQEIKSHLFKNTLPEDISRKADTISGLKGLEKELIKVNNRALIDRIKKFKAADLVLKGKLRPTDSVKSFLEVLKDRESLAYLVEALGRDSVNELLKLSADLQKSGKLVKIGEALIDVIKTLLGSKKEAAFKILKKVFTEENIDRMIS